MVLGGWDTCVPTPSSADDNDDGGVGPHVSQPADDQLAMD